MTEWKDAEQKKREELYKGIIQLGIENAEAKKIFKYLEDECIIEITPPQLEESSLQMVRIRDAHTGRFKGKSYKPGNIILNLKDAMGDFLVFGASTAASIGGLSISHPVITILTILTAVLSAANLGKIELDDNAVLILAVLWKNRHTNGCLTDMKAGLELVNRYLESYNREKLSEAFYYDLLGDLRDAGCIALKDDKIELIETIHITY